MAEIRDDTIDNVVVDTTPQDNIVDNTELDRVNVGETQYIVKNLDLNSLEFAPSDGEFVYNQNKAIYSGIFTYTVEGQTTPKQASGEIVLNISSGNGISISEDLTDSNLVISLNAETISAIESISTLQADISALQSGKVDKVQGKGLSTNDYTTEEKNKLASITPQNYSLITETGSIITLEINSSTYEITASLKDKNGNVISTSQSVDLPLESVVVSGRYDATNQKIVLELENGNTIDVPVGALVSGLQSEITSTNKLDADLVDDTTSANKFVSAQEKSTWNAKQDAISDLSTIRSGASAGATAVQDANYVHTDNNYTSEDKTKVANALTSETDPTVPNWAKQPNKPTYDYTEITNTPTIPTVNNPTITITQGGVTKGSFTLNQATGDTIALDAGGQQNVVSDAQVDDVSVVSNSVAKIYTKNGDYDASTNKLVTENDLPDVSVKVDKVSTTNKLYGTGSTAGSQVMWEIDQSGSGANAIPQRKASGSIAVPTPTANEDTANKKYVDDADALKQDKFTEITENANLWELETGTYLAPNLIYIAFKTGGTLGDTIPMVGMFNVVNNISNSSGRAFLLSTIFYANSEPNGVSGEHNYLRFDTTPTENSIHPVTSGGVYNAIEPNFVELYTNAEIKLTANTWTTVGSSAGLTLKNSSGNKLTFENYAVKIASGVSKVRVYAKGRFYCNSTNTRFQVVLKKNGGSAGGNVDYSSSDCKMQYVQFQVDFECIVNVAENDTLTLSVLSSNSNSSNKDGLQTNSVLIVEVIE